MISAVQRTTPLADPSRERSEFSRVRLGPWPALLLAGLSCWVAGCEAPRHDPVDAVILISCDTLRADRLGFYGYERDVSPNLDAFAENAVVFERAYATAPHTNPALSSLMTSRLPDELGVSGGNRVLMPSEVETLAEMLADAGIPSAAIVSNWALRRPNGTESDVGLAQGFAHFDDRMGSSASLREGHFERIADATTDAAIGWLDQIAGQNEKFFLWVHYQDPHGPYTPPEAFRGTFQSEAIPGFMPPLGATQDGFGQIPHYQILDGMRAPDFYRDRYDEEIRYFDHEVGRLLAWLDDHDVGERSLVVFTADHGESLGEHNYWFTHEANLYDEEVRVPLVIRYPAGLPRPSGRALVGHLDFVPTVLDAFGLPGRPVRGVTLIAQDIPDDRVMPHSLHPFQDPRRWFGVSDGRYRLVIPRSGPELYDLREDPGELHNLAHSDPARVQDLIARYEAMMKEVPALAISHGVERDLDVDVDTRRALEALGYLPPTPDPEAGSDTPPREAP